MDTETMADEKGYNGWKNYETWDVALWIDNDEGIYGWIRGLVRDAESKTDAADLVKEAIEQEAPPMPASLYSDLLTAALGQVDWYEIVEHYIEDEAE